MHGTSARNQATLSRFALAFIASAAATLWSCRSMSAMGAMPMPGGWSMSTIWTPSCGQTWLGAAVAFVRMWTLMMATMMLPASTPELRQLCQRTHAAARIAAAWPALLTLACYLLWWAAAGTIVFIAGNALATKLPQAAALARLIPIGSQIVIVIAGAVQFTSWKARRIGCAAAIRCDGIEAVAACRQGFRLALHGGCCCANLMAVLLLVGLMDLRAMAAITAAMSLERLAYAHARVGSYAAKGIGIAVVVMGLCKAAQATRFL